MSAPDGLLGFTCARLAGPASGPSSAASSFSDPSSLASLTSLTSYDTAPSSSASPSSAGTLRPPAPAPAAVARAKSFPHNADLVGRRRDDGARFDAAAMSGGLYNTPLPGRFGARPDEGAMDVDPPPPPSPPASADAAAGASSPLDSPTYEPVPVSALVAVPPLARAARPVRIAHGAPAHGAVSASAGASVASPRAIDRGPPWNELGLIPAASDFAYAQPRHAAAPGLAAAPEPPRPRPAIADLLNTAPPRAPATAATSPRTALAAPATVPARVGLGPVRSGSRERRHDGARRPSALAAHRPAASAAEPSVPPPRPSPRSFNYLPYPPMERPLHYTARWLEREAGMPHAAGFPGDSDDADVWRAADVGDGDDIDIGPWPVRSAASGGPVRAARPSLFAPAAADRDATADRSPGGASVAADAALAARSTGASLRLARLDAARSSTYDSAPYASSATSLAAEPRRLARWDSDGSSDGAPTSGASRLFRLGSTASVLTRRLRDPDDDDDASDLGSPATRRYDAAAAASTLRPAERRWGELSPGDMADAAESASDRLRRRVSAMRRVAERRDEAVRDSAERSTAAAAEAAAAADAADDGVLRVQLGLERAQRGLERARHNIEQAQRSIRRAEGSLYPDTAAAAAAAAPPDSRIGFGSLLASYRRPSPESSVGSGSDAPAGINEFDYQIRNYSGMQEWAARRGDGDDGDAAEHASMAESRGGLGDLGGLGQGARGELRRRLRERDLARRSDPDGSLARTMDPRDVEAPWRTRPSLYDWARAAPDTDGGAADVDAGNAFDGFWRDRHYNRSAAYAPGSAGVRLAGAAGAAGPAAALAPDDTDLLPMPTWIADTPRSLLLSRLFDMRALADEPPAALARLASGPSASRPGDREDVLRWAAAQAARRGGAGGAGGGGKAGLVERTLTVRAHAALPDHEREECCPVCQDEYEATDVVSTTPCAHTYHKGCLDSWLQTPNRSTCPMCRRDLAALGFLARCAPFASVEDALPHWLGTAHAGSPGGGGGDGAAL